MCSLRSRTGLTVIWASGLPHHCRICSACTGPRVFSTRPNSPGQRGAGDDGGVGEVHVQHHLTRLAGLPRAAVRASRSPSAGRGRRPGRVAVRVRGRRGGVEVEGELAAGEVPDGGGPPHVQGVGGAEVLQRLGAGGDGGVEVEGVGEVELPVHGAGAPQRRLPRVDGEGPAVGGLAAAAFGLLGHEPPDRLLDQPVDLGGADLVRHVRDVAVDVRGGLHRQDHGRAGDPAGPPGGQVALDHPGPDPVEAVAELDGLAEVGLAGLGRAARSRRRTR